jgi:hypothetical protein
MKSKTYEILAIIITMLGLATIYWGIMHLDVRGTAGLPILVFAIVLATVSYEKH